MAVSAARSRFADLLGIGLSLTCLLHCLALPLLLLAAPALSGWVRLPEGVHAAILLLALPAAAMAMSDGWRHHQRLRPIGLAVTGLILLTLGLSAHEGWIAFDRPEAADRLATSIGALTLAAAHIVNWRLTHEPGKAAR